MQDADNSRERRSGEFINQQKSGDSDKALYLTLTEGQRKRVRGVEGSREKSHLLSVKEKSMSPEKRVPLVPLVPSF